MSDAAENVAGPLVAFRSKPHADALRLLQSSCRTAALKCASDSDDPWPPPTEEASGLLVFMSDRVDECLLDSCPRLRIVAGALKGADNIDVSACSARGVWVTVVDELLSKPTAELAVTLLLVAARRVREGDALVRGAQFRGWRRQLPGFSVRGASVGIVGLGSLGREIVPALSALGATCGYHDPSVATFPGARALDLEDLLAQSRAVVLAAPLTADTRGMVDARRIAMMPRGSVLVNVGRGSCVDENAVAEALADGHLAAYAADVFAMEDTYVDGRPSRIPHGLLMHPRSVFTPHLGTACPEARREIELTAARSVLQALRGEHPSGAINQPQIRARMSVRR